MAKSAKKRVENGRGVKKVSAKRSLVGVRNLEVVNKIAYES
jgi:hypothetical protein